MTPRARGLLPVALVCALAIGCRSRSEADRDQRHEPPVRPAASARAAGPARPRLVVLVIVDQLPSWSFEQVLRRTTGGFARMMRSSAYYRRGELPFSATSTSAGHAALGTGAPPAVNGIIGNDWFRPPGESGPSDGPVPAASDPDHPVLSVAGASGSRDRGESPRALLVEGIADALERATGGAAVTVGVSLKPRSAIFPLGRHPDLAVWYDADQAAMTTSTYYAGTLPPWLSHLAEERPASRFFREVWQPGDPTLLAELAGGPDDQPGDTGDEGFSAAFPHPMASMPSPAAALVATPYGTELVFDTAEAAIRGAGLGADEVPDLLTVSVSSHDYAGHFWGQESWERIDLFLRLDTRLGQFFDRLDQIVGAGRWAAIVTSDHGATHLLERAEQTGQKVYRIDGAALRALAEKIAVRALGRGPWIRGMAANMIYMTARFEQVDPGRRRRALAAIAAELARVTGVALALPTADLAGDCAKQNSDHRRRACAALAPGSMGAIYLEPLPGSRFGADHPGGAGHGNASDDERTVPILVYAPGQERRQVGEPRSILQVAPTLALLLGVPPPAAATEPPLD
jgi:hypothetical protein